MNTFLEFFAHQKKLALAFTVSIIVIGFVVLQDIQRDLFPSVSRDGLTITTSYPNSSPEDVEINITNVIEEQIQDISGVEKITSTSRAGFSNISIDFDSDAGDIQSIKDEITEAVNGIRNLPDQSGEPSVRSKNTSDIPILTLVIDASSVDHEIAEHIANDLEKNLTLVDGVSSISVSGDADREIQIRVDPVKLDKYQLTFDQLSSAITKQNVRSTVGDNNQGDDKMNIVIISEHENIESLENVIVKSSYDGPIIYLKDIATVSQGETSSQSITRVNGKKGYVLRVRKSENADIIKTVELIRAQINKLSLSYPQELNLLITNDKSKEVSNRLEIVTNNAALGLVLILVVLGVFLSLKTAFWVALSIPVSLLGTVAFLGFAGETINLISLTAMILVVGIVVDDSIIIAESIHHYKAKGGDIYKSVVAGFKRVFLPVLTTVLTTIIAMSTILMMGGNMGRFIYILPMTVICALVLSVLEISFALPAHLAAKKDNTQRVWFEPVEEWFERQLRKTLKWRLSVISAFIALLIGTAFYALTSMNFVVFPSDGSNSISVRVETEAGSSASVTEKAVIAFENIIIEQIGENLDYFTSSIGPRFTNRASIAITLVSANDQSMSADEIVSAIQDASADVENVLSVNSKAQRPGPTSAGSDVEFNLIGNDNVQRTAAANHLEKILANINGVTDIDRDDDVGNPRVKLVLDYPKMAKLGIDYQQIYNHLRTIYSGKYITEVTFGNNHLSVQMYLGENNYSEEYINQTSIRNNQGMMVPMAEFSSLQIIQGEPDYKHLNGERVLKVSGAVSDTGGSSGEVMEQALLELDVRNNYPNIRIIEGGGAVENTQTLNDFYLALGIAVFGIFILITLLFNSYSQPLLVITGIPFALIGVVWTFALHGIPFSFFVMMGVLALVGVIVNDSLVMVSHLNYLRSQQAHNSNPSEWIAKGSRDRLRAVVLTTLTTLAGVLPLAYGIGGKDPLLQPMVMALGYGLLFGTLITLVLLPCLYSINHDLAQWISKFRPKPTS